MKQNIIYSLFLFILLLTTGCEVEPDKLLNLPVSNNDGQNVVSTSSNISLTPLNINKWNLWFNGTKLRGANIYQRRVYKDLDDTSFGPGPVGPVYTQKDFDDLVKLGANWMQIEHPGLYTEKSPYKLDEGMQNNLDKLINMAQRANLFVTIAFRTGPGRSEFTFYDEDDSGWFPTNYRNDSVWQEKDAQDAWLEMWRHTANRYKTNPVVVGFNLMVEPNGESRAFQTELSEPDEFYPKYANSLADWNQLYPKLVSAIRQVDTSTPILVGPMFYNSATWLPYLKKINDQFIVYIVHQYEPYAYTHDMKKNSAYPGNFKWYGETVKLDKSYLDNIYSLVASVGKNHQRPVTIDEFGVYRWKEGADKFLDDSMVLMESKNMNYAIWVWDSVEHIKNFSADDEFNFTHGAEKQNYKYIENKILDVIKRYWARNAIRPYK